MFDYKELLKDTGLLDHKSWLNFPLVHEKPADENGKKRIFSDIYKNCRKQGKLISGIYLYERQDEIIYIGKGNPISNRLKSHYNESYYDVHKGKKDNKWHRFFNKYNGSITVYVYEIEREADRQIIEILLHEIYTPIFSNFK